MFGPENPQPVGNDEPKPRTVVRSSEELYGYLSDQRLLGFDGLEVIVTHFSDKSVEIRPKTSCMVKVFAKMVQVGEVYVMRADVGFHAEGDEWLAGKALHRIIDRLTARKYSAQILALVDEDKKQWTQELLDEVASSD